MSPFELIKDRVDKMAAEISYLAEQIETIDKAASFEENPEYASVLADILGERIEQFHMLETEFKELLIEFDRLSIDEKGTLNFTARKVLKAVG